MKILVTGDTGMVGRAFTACAKRHGHEVFESHKYSSDLANNFLHMVEYWKPTHVLHLAARVGGVGANLSQQADFARINTRLAQAVVDGVHTFNQGHKTNVKLCSVLSTCIYPKWDYALYPLTENQIHNGPPEGSNYGYAYAKRMLEVLTRSHREQYGYPWISLVPCNVFGEGDLFSEEGGHVIPALIARFCRAKRENLPEVVIWGNGTPRRQFSYSKDLAWQMLQALEHYDDSLPLNCGTETVVSIRDTVDTIREVVGYPEDRVVWDIKKPMGQYEKPASLARLRSQGWYKPKRETSLKTAIKNTVRWYEKNYPNVRGANIQERTRF